MLGPFLLLWEEWREFVNHAIGGTYRVTTDHLDKIWTIISDQIARFLNFCIFLHFKNNNNNNELNKTTLLSKAHIQQCDKKP